MSFFNKKNKKNNQNKANKSDSNANPVKPTIDLSEQTEKLPRSYEERLQLIEELIQTDDLKGIKLEEQGISCYFLTTIIDLKRFNDEIAPRLQEWVDFPEKWHILFPQAVLRDTTADTVTDLLEGHIVMNHRGLHGQAVTLSMLSIKSRAVEKPDNEKMILGPKESFTEDLETNIGLTRRWLKDPNMVFHYFQVGERSKTRVAVGFIRDITNPDWVHEIETNLKKINIDRIIGHKDVMDLIIGKTNTPFPLYELTELPARIVFDLSEGRIAILVDGSPFSAILPCPLLSMYIGSEYVMQGGIIPLFVRSIRVVAAFLALYAPAFYVALVSINSSIIPVETGVVLAADQLGIPYPTVIEALLLFIILDIFIEASTYVPGAIGPAMNIVGSLIIGQAASQAHLVSHVIIIVSAITAVGTYVTLYQLSMPIRIWKYPLIIAAAVLGLYGIIGCTVILIAHLCGLKSLGVPYLSPFAPLRWKDLLNGAIWDKDRSESKKRLSMFKAQDKVRQEGDPDA
ncbi:MAG: spore germination protein [Paenibacillaceae bacterium]